MNCAQRFAERVRQQTLPPCLGSSACLHRKQRTRTSGQRLRMTPAEFAALAEQIAGPRWRTALGPIIGKGRTQVWEYAKGRRAIPATVEKLMRQLVASLPKSQLVM